MTIYGCLEKNLGKLIIICMAIATCAIPELTNLAFVHAVEQLTSMEFLPFWQPDNGFIRRKEGTKDLDRTKAKYSPCLLRVIRVPVQRLFIQ